MTYDSYPAVGNNGFDKVEWADMMDAADGIINDVTGGSLALTRINTGEIARLAPGKVRVAGYVLNITAAHDLTVSTAAGTYYIWACYDPALNVADGSGNAAATGPCLPGISTGLPSTAGSKQYVMLYKIVRAASQALTAATVTSYRRWTGPQLWVESPVPSGELADPEVNLLGYGPLPLGTTIRDNAAGKTYRRVIDPAGGLAWEDINYSGITALTLVSGFVTADTAPYYYLTGGLGHLHMRGTIKRSSGAAIVSSSSSSDVQVASVPVGLAPVSVRRFIVYADDGNDYAAVKIEPTGVLWVKAGGHTIDSIDLSSIQWQVGA